MAIYKQNEFILEQGKFDHQFIREILGRYPEHEYLSTAFGVEVYKLNETTGLIVDHDNDSYRIKTSQPQ